MDSYSQLLGHSMESFSPAKFSVGDIVELQVSFMAVSTRNQYRMKSILRSIALLSDSHTQVLFTFNSGIFILIMS
jgi:hypothetical protein